MIEVIVKNMTGSDVSTLNVNEDNLGSTVRRKLLKQAVLMYEANKRQGTACTKRKSDKAGSTRKLYRQKGTGRARAGMLRSPTRRGGGKAFGPEPRDYSYDIGRKSRQLARMSALLAKLQAKKVLVLDSLALADHKTKSARKLLTDLGLRGTVTFVPNAYDSNLHLAARNLPGIQVKPLGELSAYDLLRPRTVVIEQAAIESLVGKSK
jgi:large subunit ribosomal protein L4